MRMSPENGFFDYKLRDSSGAEIPYVAWADDATLEYCCWERPLRLVGNEYAKQTVKVSSMTVDHVDKTIHVTRLITVRVMASNTIEIAKQPQACSECMQEQTCRRISYCAAYKCCFGEVSKP